MLNTRLGSIYAAEPVTAKAPLRSLCTSIAEVPRDREDAVVSGEASLGPAAVAMDRVWLQKFVAVHSGARDGYQLARALSEAGMLEVLITDLFFPADRKWARAIARLIPKRLRSMLLQRSDAHLSSAEVRQCAFAGLLTLLFDKLPKTPLSVRRRVTRYADATLGRTAGRFAAERSAGLLSYSYYGYDAFTHYQRPAILFQMHPHPVSIRRILTEELEANPDCAQSLQQEWELSLPEKDFQHLVRETTMASHYLVASSFTRETLVENGVARSSISVIPYGVDTARFTPDARRRSGPSSKLELLFVGRINQRKGIKYLLEALRLLGRSDVRLTVCGRVVDGLELFRSFAGQVEVRPSVSPAELVAAYQSADMFVFPSVAEGFGLVLLEALACGLPILSTTRTATPDLIQDGVQGFIVEPRRPDLIAGRIDWALDHRKEVAEMGHSARVCAERFSWQRFRAGVVQSVQAFAASEAAVASNGRDHV
jgi:glycosyltransferase involved in cell wall biosynthesis